MVLMAGLLASMMWMISDRQTFWNADELSEKTQMSFVHSDGTFDKKRPKLAQLNGKKVLILIHGYNNSKEVVLPAYFAIKSQVDQLFVQANGKIYDEVIGYVWPGCESSIQYYDAKEHAAKVSKRVSQLIDQIGSTAKQVDVMAHSMGNYLFLEAMKAHKKPNQVANFFSLGAAVDDESIQQDEVYGLSIKNCRDVYVVFSNEDDVLNYLYTIVEFDRALGSAGIEDISRLPPHVQLVDCSEVVGAHDKYHQATQVYTFVRDRLLGTPPLPEDANSVKILESNEVVVVLPVGSNTAQTNLTE